MQAITIAIGKNGIDFFARHYLQSAMQELFKSLKPPDRSMPIDKFSAGYTTYSNLVIQLSNGSINELSPIFHQVVQGLKDATPIFTLSYGSSAFHAQYTWSESYHWVEDYTMWRSHIHKEGNTQNTYGYSPSFAQLELTMEVTFVFDKPSNAWEVTVRETSGKPQGEQANIPADSVIRNQVVDCSGWHISEATAQMISSIDFGGVINQTIKKVIASIPGSGHLSKEIMYDFSLGDSGLLFPHSDGIQMGVKGGASYNGLAFSGATPPALPLPTPPADSDAHHLNMYISNYEVDALNWAYTQAGKLNLVITPQELKDQAALMVKTYLAMEPSLSPYAAFVMHAQISQNNAPVTTFQTTYVFSSTVMDYLKNHLPDDVYTLIQALPGNAYLSKGDLEAFLTTATVAPSYFATIENAGMVAAMVIRQNMTFNLTIQNGKPTLPYIKFGVQRADVLTGLKLGASADHVQTMQYGFANASNSVSYIGSSIPGFNGTLFSEVVWPVTAEAHYVTILSDMGETGVPLPIMQGFQFDFASAQLSIQEGYVSILADVEYKS